MLSTLTQRFHGGQDRFDRPGEALFAAWIDARLVGVGGLSRDPYLDAPRLGRVRRLYVHPRHRRVGVGAALVRAVEAAAGGHFDRLRLYTPSTAAARFYEQLGYLPATGEHVSHDKLLQAPNADGRTGG